MGKVLPDMALQVGKVIKGNLQLQSKLQLDKQESCYQKSSVVNQVFFLAPDRHGRSLARHGLLYMDGTAVNFFFGDLPT